MVSKSPKMRRVFDLIKQVGPLGSTVLIQGETGTGKELVARAVHASDTRRRGPFVALNCAALNESLLESELFGHERGAFTGAERQKKGRFELADGGTLFLDEIGEISASMQSKLLRVLQTGRVDRLGGGDSIAVDVRIVAATNKRLEDEVKAGRYRQDLFFRIAVIRVDLPPLRERTEDVPLLAMHFLQGFSHLSTPPVTEIQASAMQALVKYEWPGNVRELQNAIRAAVAMADGTVSTSEAAVEAAIVGSGVTRVMSYKMEAARRSGALVLVLEDFEKDPLPVHILYAERKPMPLKLRVFLDWLTPRLKVRLAPQAE